MAPPALAAEQAYLGEHMAYCTTFGLMCVAALVIIFLVRNRPVASAGCGGHAGRARCGSPWTTRPAFPAWPWTAPRRVSEPGAHLRAAEVMNREPVCAAVDTAIMAEVIRLMDANPDERPSW